MMMYDDLLSIIANVSHFVCKNKAQFCLGAVVLLAGTESIRLAALLSYGVDARW